ncbi:MAG: family 43 glycosylhydrolase [Bacteroidales bacterium]
MLFFLVVGLFSAVLAQAQEPRISVHDPVMIRENGVFYIFATGQGISVWSSTDMQHWKREKRVFDRAPEWAVEAVPGFRGHIWAPDISWVDGRYYLYYSVSTFGKNGSCIGLATNATLDANAPEYKWIDHGMVIRSVPGEHNWNAIDPNLILDTEGKPWLSFGSFWDGLKLLPLQADLKSVPAAEIPITIASRLAETDKGANPIEAPFIVYRAPYYYLFASIDYCCKGVESTYKMIVGRSRSLTGPYVDDVGRDLRTGGGRLLMEGDVNWHGVGHNAVVNVDSVDYLLFHAYDAADNGRSKLRIVELEWTEDAWPFPATFIY